MTSMLACSLLFLSLSVAYVSCLQVEDKDVNAEPMKTFWWRPLNFKCPAIYGRYPHETDCALFYECRFGYPTLMRCHAGLLYDEDREQCRVKNKVRCSKGGNKGVTDVIEEEIPRVFVCPYIWGTFAHPRDCSKYFICIYNVPTLYMCYGTDLYDARERRCKYKHLVNCGKRLDRDQMRTSRKQVDLPRTTPMYPNTAATKKPKPPVHKFGCPFPYGRYPDPEDCSRYYECRFSIPTLYQCPKSTLYDERRESCMEDKYVRCGNRPGGVGGGKEPEKDVRVVFRCPYIWGTFPHPEDCSKYIICIYNVPTLFSCRKHELFHAYYRRCFPKEQVSCDYRINPDDLTPPTKKTSIIPTKKMTTPTTTTTPTTPQTTATTTTKPTTTATTSKPKTATSPTPAPTPKVTKPNTPPPTDCDEYDLDCIIDETGDITKWFECPQRYGHFPHGSSIQLFIHCDNWIPFVKKCAEETAFSPKYLVCMWIGKRITRMPTYSI
ncbi:uncharacterized protein LOC118196503 isoform X1 [Stegodyphus dumicola]|uniref:uncharacterized protein LOC118196503 isoform X1 n=1 Tax=Stegodyphus dumicola TaxID=202533 RepID=UPI0015AC3175|nr:uncharacterized protein LOC118196503 isoform X1 [Stegodyphus dumicola]